MVMIGGSYEEYPPTIVDHALRDRRWMQGNLQHLRLLGASGLAATSRLHLLIGASAYLTSPGWLLLLLATIAQVAMARVGGGVEGNALTTVPGGVLALTVLLLFGPKLMGLIWILADGQRCAAFGGPWRALRSVLAELVLSTLFAPVSMVLQIKALLGLLLGIPRNGTRRTAMPRRSACAKSCRPCANISCWAWPLPPRSGSIRSRPCGFRR
jgi:membrane glycosyltransferase